MLRLIFVTIIIVAGAVFSAQGAFHGLLFYMWNAYFRPEYWIHSSILFKFHISLIVAIYVIIRTVIKLPNPQLNIGTFLILAFFGQTFVGTVTSEAPDRSWIFFDGFWRNIVITYLIVVLVDDLKKFRWVILVMVLSLSFEAAKQGWANLILAPGQPNTNPYTFLGDNNGVAMGMIMLMPLIGALIQTTTRTWEKNMLRFVGVGVLLRGISTYSRGGFLGGLTLMAVMMLRSEKKLRAAAVIVLLSGFIYVLMPQSFWDRMDTITIEDGEIRDDSSAGRLHFWQIAQDMANAKPWTGVGLYAFGSSFLTYNTDSRFANQERQTHSAWYGVLAELGYPGLFLLAANLGYSLWACWRVHRLAKKRDEFKDLRIWANAMIGALSVYGVCAVFLSVQYLEMAWHLIGLSIALHVIARSEVTRTPAEKHLQQVA